MQKEGREVLLLRVRALEKYKQNYELLCSQLGELNTQVGLQLQRHEMDVTTLQGIIRTLEKEIEELQIKVADWEAKYIAQETTIRQDNEYNSRIQKQLATVADSLKASELKYAEREREMTERVHYLQHQAAHEINEKSNLKHQILLLEEQIREIKNTELEQPKAPNFEIDYHRTSKELKKARKQIDEQQNTIQDLQRQCNASKEEQTRLQLEYEREHEAFTSCTAHFQKEMDHLHDMIKQSREHAKTLEGQLNLVEVHKAKSNAQFGERNQNLQAELVTARTQLQVLTDERAKDSESHERRVRDIKVRWKQDREKLKRERDSSCSDSSLVISTLRDELHEFRAQQLLLQQKNQTLHQEIAMLQGVLAQVQVMEDTQRDSLVGRARQRALVDRKILESAMQDHVHKNASSSWEYTR